MFSMSMGFLGGAVGVRGGLWVPLGSVGVLGGPSASVGVSRCPWAHLGAF